MTNLQYTTGEITQFNIPIKIRTEGYYENIRDVKLEGVKIINNVKNQFKMFTDNKDGRQN